MNWSRCDCKWTPQNEQTYGRPNQRPQSRIYLFTSFTIQHLSASPKRILNHTIPSPSKTSIQWKDRADYLVLQCIYLKSIPLNYESSHLFKKAHWLRSLAYFLVWWSGITCAHTAAPMWSLLILESPKDRDEEKAQNVSTPFQHNVDKGVHEAIEPWVGLQMKFRTDRGKQSSHTLLTRATTSTFQSTMHRMMCVASCTGIWTNTFQTLFLYNGSKAD